LLTNRKGAVAAAFGQAVTSYDQAADLQREVAHRLAQRITRLPLPSRPRVLELGCGTGFLAHALQARGFDPALWVMTDLAPPMVNQCRATWGPLAPYRFLVMDGEQPSLAKPEGAGFDLICASLVFQWFEALEASLHRLVALLAPGGCLAFAVPAARTFAEWRQAHAALGLSCGVPHYPTPEALNRLWPEGGHGTVEPECLIRRYPDGRAFLHDLKRIGAHVPAAGHRPLSAGALRQVLRWLEGPEGVAARYEVAYGLFITSGGREAP